MTQEEADHEDEMDRLRAEWADRKAMDRWTPPRSALEALERDVGRVEAAMVVRLWRGLGL